jgi:hypothetical protein
MKTIAAFRDFSSRLSGGLGNSVTQGRAAMKKHWRAWAGRVAWPWLRSELEIIAKVAGVVTLSLWLKRLIEQFVRGEGAQRVDPAGRDERRRAGDRTGRHGKEVKAWSSAEVVRQQTW